MGRMNQSSRVENGTVDNVDVHTRLQEAKHRQEHTIFSVAILNTVGSEVEVSDLTLLLISMPIISSKLEQR